MSHNTGEEEMFSGQWLRLKRIFWQNPRVPEKQLAWETLERTTKGLAEVDAVEVIGILRRKDTEPHFILLKQFRPPVGKTLIELPAGLLDKGENSEECGIRELKEETGYLGKMICPVSCTMFFGPAVSNTSSKVIIVEVNGDAPENLNPKQELEELEAAEVVLVPISGLLHFLSQSEQEGYAVDGKLWMLGCGFGLANLL